MGSVARWLCALWLSLEFLLVGFSPVWGLILPHDHVGSARLSDEDWREHWEAHQLGQPLRTDPWCGLKSVNSADHQILSALSLDAADSILSAFELAGIVSPQFFLAQPARVEKFTMRSLNARAPDLSPLDPPPIPRFEFLSDHRSYY